MLSWRGGEKVITKVKFVCLSWEDGRARRIAAASFRYATST